MLNIDESSFGSQAQNAAAVGSHRLRWSVAIVGVAASAALALSTSGALAQVAADVSTPSNLATSGSLVVHSTGDQTGTCTNNVNTTTAEAADTVTTDLATCSIARSHHAGRGYAPGQASRRSETITNVGKVGVRALTLRLGQCQIDESRGAAQDFCGKLDVTITQIVGGTAVTVTPPNSTAASLANTSLMLGGLESHAEATYDVAVTVAQSAGDVYQGLSATQSFVWGFIA